MKYLNLTIQIQLIIFTLIFILSRFDNIIFFNTLDLYIDPNYKLAINDFFWEYLVSQHISPIGKIFYDKIIFSLSDLSGIKISVIFYSINIITTYLFYYFIILYLNKIYEEKIILKFLLFLFVVCLSISFDNYELWRPHYHDHLTFLLVAFFSVFLIFRDNFENKSVIYFIFFYLVISYTLGITFFITSFFFIFIFQFKNKIFLKSHLVLFIIIFICFNLISLKTYYNVKVFSPTSNGGANLIQRTLHSIGNDNYYNLINNSDKLPKWFKICNNHIYDNYSNLKEENNDNFQSKIAHGQCFLDKNSQFDLSEFKKNILNDSSNIDFIKTIDKDLINLKKQKWFFSGAHNELSYTTTAVYISYGSHIFFSALKYYPSQMIVGKIGKKGIGLTFLQMLSYGGLFPDYYEKFSYPERGFYFSSLYNLLITLIIIINLLTPYVIYKKIRKIFASKKIEYKDIIYFMFVSIIIVQIFLTSTITCCENPRIAVIYFPIIFIILLFNIENVLKERE